LSRGQLFRAAADERPKGRHVLPVGFCLDGLRRFEQFRDEAETCIVEQKPERLEAKLALADVLMAVDAAATSLL